MVKLLIWFFSKPRLTHCDITCFVLTIYVDAWWFLPILIIGMILGEYIGGMAEAWRDDKGGS